MTYRDEDPSNVRLVDEKPWPPDKKEWKPLEQDFGNVRGPKPDLIVEDEMVTEMKPVNRAVSGSPEALRDSMLREAMDNASLAYEHLSLAVRCLKATDPRTEKYERLVRSVSDFADMLEARSGL